MRAVCSGWIVGCLLMLAACDAEPAVVVGKARTAAQNRAGAGGSRDRDTGHDDGEHAGDDGRADDDFVTHECTEDDPVCGVDGVTYMNRCQATLAGVEVARRGSC